MSVTTLKAIVVPSANISGNTFTSVGHGFVTGTRGQFTTDGSLPSPLVTSTDYFLYVLDADTFAVCSSLFNALSAIPITLTDSGTGNQTFQSAASSLSVNPVAGNVVSLFALGDNDTYPESSLIYTWSLTGIPPAGVSYSDNGTNTAKSTTVTFFKAGTYNFLVTITDPLLASATSPVTVIIDQVYTSVAIDTIPTTPDGRNVIIGTLTQFDATALDQFGDPLAVQPVLFIWTVTSGGPIDSSGLFNATLIGGPYQVHAQSGAHIGTSNFSVIGNPNAVPPPILWDRGTLAAGVIIHVLNPAHFSLNQDLIRSLVTPLLPAHVKVYFVFDE